MTDTASMGYCANSSPNTASRLPTAAHIATLVLYTGFAIPVAIVAMNMFGMVGLLLAAFLAWQWTRLARPEQSATMSDTVQDVAPVWNAEQETKSSGNANFDAYRGELLNRLEKEQEDFEGFLARLRDAKDKSEFDRFMDDRAKAARQTSTFDDKPIEL